MSHLTLSISPEEQALREYLKFEAAQIRKIQRGLAAADSGDFASDEEVEAFFAKYGGDDFDARPLAAPGAGRSC